MSVRNQTNCKNTNCGIPVCEPCKCEKYQSIKEMIIEQELKDRCTPEFIKRMVELAGFIIKFETDEIVAFTSKNLEHKWYIIDHPLAFSTLIHRAVEGWNKSQKLHREIVIYKNKVCEEDYKLETHNGYEDYYKYTYMNNYFKNYQPCHITACEMAIWDCLLEVLK